MFHPPSHLLHPPHVFHPPSHLPHPPYLKEQVRGTLILICGVQKIASGDPCHLLRNTVVHSTIARSINIQRDEPAAYVPSEKPDIRAIITETWIITGHTHLSSELAVPGYKVFSKDRLHKAGGGGMIYDGESLM